MWTFPPRTIVVGVDFAPASSAALALAGVIAKKFAAGITAVHAESFEPPPYFTPEQVQALNRQDQAARRDAERHLERIASRDAGLPVKARVDAGSAADVVLVHGRAADLIAVGTHGRKGPSRWWLGSVAERVVRGSSVPVLVLHGGAGDTPFARIVRVEGPVGFDGGATRYADGLAAQFGGSVTAVGADEVSRSVQSAGAGLVVLPAPHPSAPGWLADVGDRLVRGCTVPLLFVP